MTLAPAKYVICAIYLIALSGLALTALPVFASTGSSQWGVVVRVVDGDTLWVKTSTGTRPLKVRLQGIDAPEICQLGGAVARDALKRQLLGQRVAVTPAARDEFGRTVATVHLNGQDIGRWLVVLGHAWVNTTRSRKGPYVTEFVAARREGRGVFSANMAEEPWRFRKRHGPCETHVR